MKTRTLFLILIFAITLIVSALFFNSCETTTSDEDLIRQLFKKEDALKATEDITPLDSIYSPSVIIYHGNNTPDTGDDYLLCDGISEVITYYQNIFNSLENIQHTSTITNIIISGDEATCNKTTTGTHVVTATKETQTLPGGTEPWRLQKNDSNWVVIEATWFTE